MYEKLEDGDFRLYIQKKTGCLFWKREEGIVFEGNGTVWHYSNGRRAGTSLEYILSEWIWMIQKGRLNKLEIINKDYDIGYDIGYDEGLEA